MTPEIGHFALVIALCLALVQGVLPLVGAQRGITQWMAAARPIAVGQFVFLAISFACLTAAFIQNDFTVLYVANNSNTALPLPYRISAVWGAHEGSLLLWSLILSGWSVAVAVFSRSLPMAMSSRVIGIMGLVSIGFLLFMLATSNPFDRLFPAALEGRDLNPLLQDFGLIIHPPMLYMGYVGFSVAFAFAIAALLGGHLDAAWARWSRPWTLVAWLFLTLGIMLGSWWAYYELGWGGWWFWDPVENASFMPWLVGTALIHSLVVTESRGTFKSWTVLLAIFAFSLSLLGTFLVRSGVLVSVHAFATDPARGTFILAFLALVIGSSLVLYAWRAPRMQSSSSFKLRRRVYAFDAAHGAGHGLRLCHPLEAGQPVGHRPAAAHSRHPQPGDRAGLCLCRHGAGHHHGGDRLLAGGLDHADGTAGTVGPAAAAPAGAQGRRCRVGPDHRAFRCGHVHYWCDLRQQLRGRAGHPHARGRQRRDRRLHLPLRGCAGCGGAELPCQAG
jgi:ABC-type transport system involved in cytochrome c biogenesis permease subunit